MAINQPEFILPQSQTGSQTTDFQQTQDGCYRRRHFCRLDEEFMNTIDAP